MVRSRTGGMVAPVACDCINIMLLSLFFGVVRAGVESEASMFTTMIPIDR